MAHFQTGAFTSTGRSLCSNNSILDFSWRVLLDLYGSDHFLILLESTDSEPQSCRLRWGLDKADWQRFRELCSSIRQLTDFGTCDEAATYFTNALY